MPWWAMLRQLAEIFALIVDAKSPFTFAHSLGVARVAKRLARYMGVAEDQCSKLEIAGRLHDLGKLRVPNEILEKPAGLDEDERSVMNAHSFQSMQILKNIQGFEDIWLWAASHHEAPGGPPRAPKQVRWQITPHGFESRSGTHFFNQSA